MKESKIRIVPSILAANLSHLQAEIASIEPYADGIQVDEMDGIFVPATHKFAPLLKNLKTKLPLDIHLMVMNPDDRVQEFLLLGASHITFHAEAVTKTADRKTLIKKICDGGATAGIAINPETPVTAIEDVLAHVDLALVMSVHPGLSGQKFLPEVLSKVRAIRAAYPKLSIQMDGGIDAETAAFCRKAGADNLVSATYVFSASDRAKAISSLRGL